MACELHVCCDRCGSAILEGRAALEVLSGPLRSRHEYVDLCKSCQVLFENWLGEFSQEDPIEASSSPVPLTAA